ncbi:MAG: hypothetical protein ACI9TY_000173 [Alphaproteobacteria bacterium]|jgi:hypothetical protein
MKKNALFLFMALTISGCIGSGEISTVQSNGENHFPTLIGIDLVGEDREIPQSFTGEYNIVAVAFEREHQEAVNTWISAVDSILENHKNIAFYEVPLIYEINAPYRFWINNGMRAGIPDLEARLRTITVYTDRDKFTSTMNMKTDRIYVLLLNKKGEILWQTQGPLTPKSESALLNKIMEINKL